MRARAFPLEPLESDAIAGERRGTNFHRRTARDPGRVSSPIDNPHSALPKNRKNTVMGDGFCPSISSGEVMSLCRSPARSSSEIGYRAARAASHDLSTFRRFGTCPASTNRQGTGNRSRQLRSISFEYTDFWSGGGFSAEHLGNPVLRNCAPTSRRSSGRQRLRARVPGALKSTALLSDSKTRTGVSRASCRRNSASGRLSTGRSRTNHERNVIRAGAPGRGKCCNSGQARKQQKRSFQSRLAVRIFSPKR